MSPADRALIARAAHFADRAHLGQSRKGTGLPYVVHPYRVALLVEEHGGAPVQIAAAWCHDVLEDCPDLRAAAETALPAPVLALVRELTKAEVAPGKRVKGEAFLAAVRAMSPTAKLIKLADRLDNLRDATGVTDPAWVRTYGEESVRLLAALRVDPATGPGAEHLTALLEAQIASNVAWVATADGGA